MDYTDDVGGFIVGGDEHPYEFWRHGEYPLRHDQNVKITGGWFANDTEAIEWFRKQYPAEFAEGCEMRVWDQ